MVNGGYKIIDLEGIILKKSTQQQVEGLYERVEKASKSGKPILINNFKIFPKDNNNPTTYTEVTTPIFLQIVKVVNTTSPNLSGYKFTIPNEITATITSESITVE